MNAPKVTGPRMSIAAITDYGFERVVMHSEDLAIGKWGTLWYAIDTIASAEIGKPSTIGIPTPQRWLTVETADARIRSGDYR